MQIRANSLCLCVFVCVVRVCTFDVWYTEGYRLPLCAIGARCSIHLCEWLGMAKGGATGREKEREDRLVTRFFRKIRNIEMSDRPSGACVPGSLALRRAPRYAARAACETEESGGEAKRLWRAKLLDGAQISRRKLFRVLRLFHFSRLFHSPFARVHALRFANAGISCCSLMLRYALRFRLA